MSFAVLNGTWPHLGVVAAALLAACAILSRDDVLRAWSMLGAMVLACALLLADVWHSSQLGVIRRHAPEAVVGAIVVLAALAVLAHLIYRRPQLAALLTVLTLPGRIPISVGGNTSNLLLPLYFVVAASALAWLVPTLWRAHGARDLPPPARRPPRHAFEWLLAAYIVLYALQALYSVNFRTALQNEVFFYVPFAVMLALLRDLDWSRRLLLRCLGLTVVLALAFALFGFVQELTHTLILNSGLYYANQLHEYFQINSIFFDPNIFGRYLALTMVLLVALMLYDRRPRVALGAIVTLAVLWGCLIFTLSRSSLAALALGMAVLAALRWRVRPVLYLAAVVIVAGAVTLAVRPRTFGLNQGFNGASSGRASLIAGGIKMFAEKPIVGWGAGSFESEYRVQFPESARNNVPDSHDIPVTVASEQGVVGLLVYLGLVIPAIITLLRGARGDPFRVAVAATFLALLLHTLFYADFLEDPITWALLAIGGALAAAAQARAAVEDRDARLARRRVQA